MHEPSHRDNLRSKGELSLTRNSRPRYPTHALLDDEFLSSQSGCMRHPLPFGLMLAWCGVAFSLTLILYLVLGGLNLG